MKANVSNSRLLKSLLNGLWKKSGPESVVRFLARDKEAFAQTEKIIERVGAYYPGLWQLHAQARAIRDANAAAAAIDAILDR